MSRFRRADMVFPYRFCLSFALANLAQHLPRFLNRGLRAANLPRSNDISNSRPIFGSNIKASHSDLQSTTSYTFLQPLHLRCRNIPPRYPNHPTPFITIFLHEINSYINPSISISLQHRDQLKSYEFRALWRRRGA